MQEYEINAFHIFDVNMYNVNKFLNDVCLFVPFKLTYFKPLYVTPSPMHLHGHEKA